MNKKTYEDKKNNSDDATNPSLEMENEEDEHETFACKMIPWKKLEKHNFCLKCEDCQN